VHGLAGVAASTSALVQLNGPDTAAVLRIDGDTATPVINIPLSRDDIPTSLQANVRVTAPEAVRERPPIVDQTWQNKNRVFPVQGPDVTVAAIRRRRR